MLTFGCYSQAPEAAVYSLPDSIPFSDAEAREIAILLDRALNSEENQRAAKVALARLIAAHNTLQEKNRTDVRANKSLQDALSASIADTKACSDVCTLKLKAANGRTWIAIGFGAAATFGAFKLGQAWKSR